MEIQVRSSKKGLTFFNTFKLAIDEIQKDPNVWKMSFYSDDGSHNRWVKVDKGDRIDTWANPLQIPKRYRKQFYKGKWEITHNLWVNQPFDYEDPDLLNENEELMSIDKLMIHKQKMSKPRRDRRYPITHGLTEKSFIDKFSSM